MTTTVRVPPNHDTTTCYTDYRCRLPECVERYNTRNRERLHARRTGTYTALVDAEPVRRHILRLQRTGMGADSIAAAAGIPKQSILEFLRPLPTQGRGRRQRTSPTTAAKILAVTFEDRTLGRIDATSTQRRIQALVACGWPVSHIARHAGLANENATDILRRRFVYVSTEKAIATTYETLRRLRPGRHGVTKAHVQAAKNRARAMCWAPPSYWDDPDHPIDDPDFQSDYGITRAEIIADEARWLIGGGLTVDQAAKQLGVSLFYVERSLREHPDTDGQAAA